MRGHVEAIRARGAELVIVGNGTAKMAAAFKEELGVDVPLLVDPALKVYRALGLERSLFSVVNPMVLARGLRAMTRGFKQGAVEGDALQQGGAFVIAKGGAVRYAFHSSSAGHHPAPEELVAALP